MKKNRPPTIVFDAFRSSGRSRGNCQAFTLMESLMVAAVLGILLALVVPQVRSYLASGQTAKCLANLKQLGQGIMLFAADHDGRLPPSEEGLGGGGGAWPGPTFGKTVAAAAPTWAEYIHKVYLGNDFRPLACPSLPAKRSHQVRGNRPDYGYNQRLSPMNSATGYREGMRLAAFERPSQIILLGESGFPSGQNPQTGYFRILGYSDLDPRHAHSTVNVLYLDLHAETHRLDFSNPPKDAEPLGRHQFVP